MKHLSPSDVAGVAPQRAPTRRALAKQQTRAKVLAAARLLFSEVGYEGATIRDIAATAGMSTGAVFANFDDKSDLFGDIMSADAEELLEVMRDAAGKAQWIEDQLLRVMMAGYNFYGARLPLARAAFGVAWSPEGRILRNQPGNVALHDFFTELLEAAVERGELAGAGELQLRSEMTFDVYLSNFVRLIYQDWNVERLEVRARDQIRMLLAGARAAA